MSVHHPHKPTPPDANIYGSKDPTENMSIADFFGKFKNQLPKLDIQVADYWCQVQGGDPMPSDWLLSELRDTSPLVPVPINIWCNLISGGAQLPNVNAAHFVAGLKESLTNADLDTFNRFMTRNGLTQNAEYNIQVFLDQNDKDFGTVADDVVAALP